MPDYRLTAIPLALAALALSACSFEAGATVPGDRLGEAAADALEGELGLRPDIDCGDDDIIAAEDKEVDCVATDPTTGEEYDATVTFTGVDGDQWNIAVSVPDWRPGQETQDDGGDTAGQGESVDSIPAADLASAAADALEAQVGARPEIDCGEADIVPEQGGTVYCILFDAGAEYETAITFTGVDGGHWGIDVQVAPEPM